MPDTRLLRREHAVVPLLAESLTEGLFILAQRLGESGALRDPAAIERAFSEQRGKSAVRAGPDIALPHYRTDAVDGVVVAIGVAPQPLRTADAEWLPGPRIVTLVLAPTDAATLYLQAVSALARAFRQSEVVEQLKQAASVTDLFAIPALASLEIAPVLTARNVMITTDDAATPDTPVRDAVERMLRSGARALAVVGDKGEVMGIVNEADVLQGVVLRRSRSNSGDLVAPLKVRDLMTRSVLCLADTASLEEVANLMINKDVGEIPVVAEGKLVGLVRRGDILRRLYGR